LSKSGNINSKAIHILTCAVCHIVHLTGSDIHL